MANLSRLMLTLEQTEEHKKLKTVRVIYGYTLNCSKVDLREALVFTVSVDILGDDLIIDDKLALNVDPHEVTCACEIMSDESITMQREFLVSQKLLDEDIGVDEIKLDIKAVATTGETCEGTTGVVRGKF
ncbi:MAG: hypothetical protein KUG75_00210 [Pseudomonadales bacterium]|nr:hypothetical protein [Pseudomonadales bacterium]